MKTSGEPGKTNVFYANSAVPLVSMTEDEQKVFIEKVRKFFNERPSLSKAGICNEAGISKGLLDMILATPQKRALTDDTVKKLLPVVKKYGYKK